MPAVSTPNEIRPTIPCSSQPTTSPHKHTAMSRARDTQRGERAAGLRACHAR